MMDNKATGHFRLQWVTVVLVVFAVFSWGVQYKLSLYDWPAKTVAATPQAKLLSQKERPIAVHEAVTGNPSRPAQPVTPYFSALIGLIAATAIVSAIGKLISTDTSNFVPSKSRPHLSYFSFRPPPFVTTLL